MNFLYTSLVLDALEACHVLRKHLLSDLAIQFLRAVVAHNEDEVKSGEQRIWQADVLDQVQLGVEVSVDWVCGSKDAAPRIERHVHASLADGHDLLLHSLVDGYAIGLVHLVKLVDTNNPSICEYHSSGLEVEVVGVRISDHRCSEAHTTRALSCSTDGQGGSVHHKTEHLGLATTWIANHKYVDVAPEVGSVAEVLFHPGQ
mmetsp:Transcript_48957/g.116438  ORF Transcript_48957/g.116438 Transcript_48957/m.116438 type:complete len:202 (+) Transcript_48957:858-1463(+)